MKQCNPSCEASKKLGYPIDSRTLNVVWSKWNCGKDYTVLFHHGTRDDLYTDWGSLLLPLVFAANCLWMMILDDFGDKLVGFTLGSATSCCCWPIANHILWFAHQNSCWSLNTSSSYWNNWRLTALQSFQALEVFFTVATALFAQVSKGRPTRVVFKWSKHIHSTGWMFTDLRFY